MKTNKAMTKPIPNARQSYSFLFIVKVIYLKETWADEDSAQYNSQDEPDYSNDKSNKEISSKGTIYLERRFGKRQIKRGRAFIGSLSNILHCVRAQ
jgi:hypothetical protein